MVKIEMEIPENCNACDTAYYDTEFGLWRCGITHEGLVNMDGKPRADRGWVCPLKPASETPKQDGDAVHCNRLKVDDAGRVCCVKDTCDGCPHVPGQCAIEDMLESLGIIDSWKRWEMPNYRERKKEG